MSRRCGIRNQVFLNSTFALQLQNSMTEFEITNSFLHAITNFKSNGRLLRRAPMRYFPLFLMVQLRTVPQHAVPSYLILGCCIHAPDYRWQYEIWCKPSHEIKTVVLSCHSYEAYLNMKTSITRHFRKDLIMTMQSFKCDSPLRDVFFLIYGS